MENQLLDIPSSIKNHNVRHPKVLKKNKIEDYKYLYQCYNEVKEEYEKVLNEKNNIQNDFQKIKLEIKNQKEMLNITLQIEKDKNEEVINKLIKEKKTLEMNIRILESREVQEVSIKDLMKIDLDFGEGIFTNIQRNLNQDHMKNLKNRIIESPDFITPFYVVKYNNKNYLIDGQHRYKAINQLDRINYDYIFNSKCKITTEICYSEKEIKEKYDKVNYQQGQITEHKDLDDINMKKFEELLLNKYEYYFKSDKGKCNKPFLRLNDFIRTLTDNIKDIKIKNENDLLNKIEKLNIYYYYEFLDKDVSGLKTIRNRYYKDNQEMFFFRLKNNWLTDLINLDNYIRRDIKNIRPIISNDFRETIWRENIGCGNSKCFCCNIEPITRKNHHLGHIVPVSKNGKTNKYNLIPICGNCNYKMGNTNMYDYMITNDINIEFAINLQKKVEIYPDLYYF